MKRLCLLMLLAACAEAPATPPPATPAPAPGGFGGIETLERPAAEFEVLVACLAEAEKALVGQPLAQARAVMPAGSRFIGPTDLVTQDYSPTRHNADYGATGLVTRVWCG